jgi:precorrin-3B C17-methyltransferase
MTHETTNSRGLLYVVGIGPGAPGLLTPDGASAIDASDVVVGYRGYLDLIADRIGTKEVVGRDLGEELERGQLALALAQSGRVVALVSSGDPGIYGMGGVVGELVASAVDPPEVLVVPGISAALSAAAKLGSPLAHDWATISLSDLLTPWEVIIRRVEAASRAGFVLVFYNPSSRSRTWQLGTVVQLLLGHRDPATPVGLVENAYRPGERIEVTRLDRLSDSHVSMFTTVIVGGPTTYVAGGKMITPRIHAAKTGHRSATRNALPSIEQDSRVLATSSAAVSSRIPNSPIEAISRGSQVGAPGERIMAESLSLIDRELGPHPYDPNTRAIVRRMIHATADFEFARNIRFGGEAIASAISAIQKRSTIVTDVEMLRAGIRRDLVGPVGIAVVCMINEPETELLAGETGLTRSAAAVRRAAEQVGDDALVAIGNAPTALIEALRLVDQGWRPACIFGIPVGFVGVQESKDRLLSQVMVPYITSLGRKGGTAVTAAVVNALLELAGASA